ncbi:MAG: hypothetical protein ISS45_11855 [Candidatus Omnitrophica bacterium]|nr:hypothetical protein [Candidatus Omnitrophota bacterium]
MTSMEKEALAKISEIKRPVHYKTIASKMKIGIEYGRLICESLGRTDYIDVDIKGLCKIGPKGRDFLESKRKKIS